VPVVAVVYGLVDQDLQLIVATAVFARVVVQFLPHPLLHGLDALAREPPVLHFAFQLLHRPAQGIVARLRVRAGPARVLLQLMAHIVHLLADVAQLLLQVRHADDGLLLVAPELPLDPLFQGLDAAHDATLLLLQRAPCVHGDFRDCVPQILGGPLDGGLETRPLAGLAVEFRAERTDLVQGGEELPAVAGAVSPVRLDGLAQLDRSVLEVLGRPLSHPCRVVRYHVDLDVDPGLQLLPRPNLRQDLGAELRLHLPQVA